MSRIANCRACHNQAYKIYGKPVPHTCGLEVTDNPPRFCQLCQAYSSPDTHTGCDQANNPQCAWYCPPCEIRAVDPLYDVLRPLMEYITYKDAYILKLRMPFSSMAFSTKELQKHFQAMQAVIQGDSDTMEVTCWFKQQPVQGKICDDLIKNAQGEVIAQARTMERPKLPEPRITNGVCEREVGKGPNGEDVLCANPETKDGHECPFRAEIQNDYTLCHCCPSCTSACKDET